MHGLSFVNTATVPVISYLEEMFNADCTKEDVAFGAVRLAALCNVQ